MTLLGEGNGPIDAAINALGLPINVQSYEERSLGKGADAEAITYLEIPTLTPNFQKTGIDESFQGVAGGFF